MNYELEIGLTVETPNQVKFITKLPDKINVTVSDKGISYLQNMVKDPIIVLRFSDYSDGNGVFRVDPSQLRRVIGRLLGNSAHVSSILPESIVAHYTDQPGKMVPVVLKMEATPAMHYTISGHIDLSQDSVMVFGTAKTLSQITEAYTYQLNVKDLTDTLRRSVSMAPIPDVLIEPNSINVVVPVERLQTRTQRVPVSVRNAPNGIHVVVFPSTVEVTYRAPKSESSQNLGEITAVVDYNSIDINAKGNKAALQIGEAPGAYVDVKLLVDSVEYIIERH